jgi:cellulose synthase/poly-beta-1,6-N-acetylglucosamine synthase-like glycosyltransferase
MSPLISIIIPVREITDYLHHENLPAMSRQFYNKFEVIVLPNKLRSKDKELLSIYPWLRIIPTGNISRPAQKRDIGVKNSNGDIIAFIDDDAYPAENWLERAVHIFKTKKVSAVCGPGLLPHKCNYWEKIFDAILQNPLGSGGYQYRFIKDTPRYVDDYPSMNFLIKKGVFDELGGFDNEYWPGEDSKLCEDLVYKKRGKIFYHPEVRVYHHRRSNLAGFLRQHANYGFHRGAFFAHGDKNSRRLSYLIPTLFVIYLFIYLFVCLFVYFFHFPSSTFSLLSSIFYLLFFPLLLYFLLSLIFLHNSLLAIPVIFLTHVIYGTMFIKGFAVALVKKNIY